MQVLANGVRIGKTYLHYKVIGQFKTTLKSLKELVILKNDYFFYKKMSQSVDIVKLKFKYK